jgi:Ca-activated chloride channel family protein
MPSSPALGFITILTVALAQSPTDRKPPLVSIPVLVSDEKMNFVTDLDKRNFKVFEGKTEQTITQFSRTDTPLSVGVVFDTSGSMGNKLRRTRQALAEFMKTVNPEDEFFLVCFGDGAHLAVGLTQNREAIQTRLAFTRAKGSTALLDVIHMAMDEIKKARNPRKALLIISDGADNSSQHTEAKIRDAARGSDAQVYAIRLYEPMPSGARMPDERSGNRLLADLSEQTGGKVHEVGNLWDLPDVVAKIGLELRNEYVLGYTPKNVERDGKYRQVKVKLVETTGSPRLTYRAGYYAPAP